MTAATATPRWRPTTTTTVLSPRLHSIVSDHPLHALFLAVSCIAVGRWGGGDENSDFPLVGDERIAQSEITEPKKGVCGNPFNWTPVHRAWYLTPAWLVGVRSFPCAALTRYNKLLSKPLLDTISRIATNTLVVGALQSFSI